MPVARIRYFLLIEDIKVRDSLSIAAYFSQTACDSLHHQQRDAGTEMRGLISFGKKPAEAELAAIARSQARIEFELEGLRVDRGSMLGKSRDGGDVHREQ